MKKSELPQDKSALEHFTREVCYVKNEEGKYDTDLSVGWDVKKDALTSAWEAIDERIEQAKIKVENGEASPILFYMELRLMDLGVLSGYTKFFKWQIKRHLRPKVFKSLSDKKLSRYAEAFEISLTDLKQSKLDRI